MPVLAARLDDIDLRVDHPICLVCALVRIGPSGVAALAKKYDSTDDKQIRVVIPMGVARMEAEAIAAESFLEHVLQKANLNEELPRALVERVRKSLRRIRAAQGSPKSQAKREE